MIAIDKGVPVPEKKHGAIEAKYPWRNLGIGDSFLHPGNSAGASSAATSAAKRTGFKFQTQSVEGGTRIWRVA